jgi:hypothetical protein
LVAAAVGLELDCEPEVGLEDVVEEEEGCGDVLSVEPLVGLAEGLEVPQPVITRAVAMSTANLRMGGEYLPQADELLKIADADRPRTISVNYFVMCIRWLAAIAFSSSVLGRKPEANCSPMAS